MDREVSDQTERMPTLIESLLGAQVILLVLSCYGLYGPYHEKTCFSHMQTIKVQISLHICAV